MTDTSKREELIEAAEVAIREAWAHRSQNPSVQTGPAECAAIAAFAVFEKAHTPTDDEREATAKAIRLSLRFELGWSADEARTLGAVLAEPVATRLAALRRTAVQEPSGFPVYFAPNPPMTTNRFASEPQSEPTDAQVEAAAQVMFEPDGAGGEYTWAEMVSEDPSRADIWREDARAALRAAFKVRGEGR